MLNIQRTFEAYLDEMDKITILLPHAYGTSSIFHLKQGANEWELIIERITSLPHAIKYECKVSEPITLNQCYIIYDERGVETDLQMGAVIRTAKFDELYMYEGNDLGASYSKEQTKFKVWAPTATKAKVRIYGSVDVYTDYEMNGQEKGIWCYELPGDWDGAQYTFLVCVNLVWREAVDPYAKSVSLNGAYGTVVNLAKTYVQDHEPLPPMTSMTDAIIYETHIRDVTVHLNSGASNKGKYLGLTEEGTVGKDGTLTALSYIKELGVTHIELLPIHHYAGVDEEQPFTTYNWGYNPLYYNVPNGSYATNPIDSYNRIVECKQMIQALHRNGLRVIIDVVYNHVYERETSSFEKLVPGYYFRHDENGMPSNGTGVGNDIASERNMVRKFIVDSVLYWLTEYNVDGFRFDLMGILDVDTMNEIREKTNAVKEHVILLGEGWDLQTPLPADKKATLQNAIQIPCIAQFNDQFRDGIKGSTFDVQKGGYALGETANKEHIQYLLTGSIPYLKPSGLFTEPVQSINYVECHDNMTMWDKIAGSSKEEEQLQKRRHRLATTMTLLAQGIPFLHAGQEFYRTKQGNENSYNAPDCINQMDWDQKEREEENVSYIKGIIRIRKSHGAFRFASSELIKQYISFLNTVPSVIGYYLQDVQQFGMWKEIIVFFHNGTEEKTVSLPNSGIWHVLANDIKAAEVPISSFDGDTFVIAPISTYILAKM
ncbi:type I pullulanase [Bacillus rhizoplanae]|uniref:type I pullulanase n=1 Tax=Bacillus rhizoplanae TaxID=2880966 RepID=UPI003D21AF8E